MIITRELLREWDACYYTPDDYDQTEEECEEHVFELVPEEGLDLHEVAELDIPPIDRVWVMFKACPEEVCDEVIEQLRLWHADNGHAWRTEERYPGQRWGRAILCPDFALKCFVERLP